ncbi:type I-E CRISPR-associated protein Cas7/Cse4/CasC [Amycolatopsis granulosa]|uniref:type I-E CRISPR-associated protein Cas7/Cse4/CasC n=1 Tax=Amycolatopsis granulosa TaxID=185684 RepID=UPI0014237193|nr:type I-E CRISPR-associated protein Cas7/Cse4/CasC [Amycolatopsis granulosa]NIH83761.1 CRISPR system Cascade subunit CasC [Amycolatopsis granulosa]
MTRTIVDIHVLQTVPPSNINRDDTGSPKTATYGGTRRARVSSQAWKRATRDAFTAMVETAKLGVRTKRVVELLAETIATRSPAHAERSAVLAKTTLEAAGIKLKEPRKKNGEPPLEESAYLLFLSRAQLVSLAALAITAAKEAGDAAVVVDKKEAKARADQAHSIDIALFGRMVADNTDLNVDAAAQVAHALSVHEAATEYDYYTAVDDHKRDDPEEDAGAGMIGTVEFTSSTLYRYATVDVDRLNDNLGDPAATREAVETFVRAFVTSMPTGKQNTFANRTLPDAVLVLVRETQSINLIGAFEDAITDRDNGSRITAAVGRLADHGREVHEAYDEQPVAGWSVGVGERTAELGELGQRTTLDTLITSLGDTVADRVQATL